MNRAGLPRRYAAWSLDAALPGLAAFALCRGRIRGGLEQGSLALEALSDTMAAMTLRALQQGLPLPAMAREWMGDPALRAGAAELAAAMVATAWPPLLAFALLGLPYHACFEGSRWQATPGKRALGLRVVGEDGGRLGAPRAFLRQAAGALSWLSLNLGHLMAALPPRHRALHDAIAGARVEQADATGALPGWTKAWLALQAFAALAAVACLFAVVDAATQAAFDRVL